MQWFNHKIEVLRNRKPNVLAVVIYISNLNVECVSEYTPFYYVQSFKASVLCILSTSQERISFNKGLEQVYFVVISKTFA